MCSFFDNYKRILEKIEKQYPVPSSKEFRDRKFGKIKWAKSEHRNFFLIIKILAENGASTVHEIANIDGLSKQYVQHNNRYHKYRRIIIGDVKLRVIGLVEKEMVKLVSAKKKNPKKYELTHYGIMYAIRIFADHEIFYSGNYKDLLDRDPRTKGYDYSGHSKFPESVLDVLAKNYAHAIPLVFGKWVYLKKNRGIDIYNLFNISTHISDNSRDSRISSNTKYSGSFTRYGDDIALEFYKNQINNARSPEHFLNDVKDCKEITEFIDKILYSYRRLCQEDYYLSEAQWFFYKGKKQNAKKFLLKAINVNDLLDADVKREYMKKGQDINFELTFQFRR